MSWLMHYVVSRTVTTSCYSTINHFFMRTFASSTLKLFLMAIYLPWWRNQPLRIKSQLPKGVHEVFAGSRRTLLAELLNVSPQIVKERYSLENCLVVPKKRDLRQLILKQAHDTPL